MRYDTLIELIQAGVGSPRYDPVTGQTISPPDTRHLRIANVTEAGLRSVLEIYGDAKVNALVARIRGSFPHRVDKVLIQGKPYKVTLTRKSRHHTALYLEREGVTA